jgi:Sulfotransferase family
MGDPRHSSAEPSIATDSGASGRGREARPKVVYVMGAGHSGSTILGLTLGNCSNVFFAGELARWLRWDGRSPLPGKERAEFWSTVRAGVAVTSELAGRNARSLEQSSALFRPTSWRSQRRLRVRYRRVTEDLYRAIARTAQASHVVDTSHFPRRARELQALGGIDLYLLFLVRRPQSVIASYEQKEVPHKQTWNMPTANAYLWLTYLLSLFAFLRHPRERRLFIRHEAFIADPEGALRDILDCIGSSADMPDLNRLRTGVAFQGNRLLRADVVALKSHPERPLKGSRLTALLHLPWTAIFSRLQPAVGASGPSTRDSR